MSPRSAVLSCLCSELLRKGTPDITCAVLRIVCAKILRMKPDLMAFVYEEYVRMHHTASLKRVRELLKLLLDSLGTTFLILDGLDEYEIQIQEQIIEEGARLLKPCVDDAEEGNRSRVKLMICSRETQIILRAIKKRLSTALVVNLTDEHQNISRDIVRFTNAKLSDLYDRFDEIVIKHIGVAITEKADGMISVSKH
jgi:hypothetical protein